MRPVAILSCDLNRDYYSLIPIVAKSWDLQGFAVVVFLDKKDAPQEVYNPVMHLFEKYCGCGFESNLICILGDAVDFLKGRSCASALNPALFTQCIRLYIQDLLSNNKYFVISDADMFIGSSFLYRDFDKINVFGHDLTGFGEIPMCYVGCTVEKWKAIIGDDGFKKDLENYGKPNSTEWHEAWGCDQQLLTAKLKNYGFDKINFINRGHDQSNAGLPMGRWDRFNWQKPAGEIHDVHLMRNPLSDESFPKIVEMCHTVYPKEDWSWLNEYREDFLKIVN